LHSDLIADFANYRKIEPNMAIRTKHHEGSWMDLAVPPICSRRERPLTMEQELKMGQWRLFSGASIGADLFAGRANRAIVCRSTGVTPAESFVRPRHAN
jgi:hypothetical protein